MNLSATIKIISIVGARPQFIKAGTISRAIVEHNRRSPDSEIMHSIIHTGQHYDENMSEVFFRELEIPKPDYNLGVGSGSHGKQTGRMLEKIEVVLLKEKPDCVIVYGDTNSTLAGALAAAKLHISVAHVEAGLRSFNRRMPEEINRIMTDHISDILFCPTETAVKNLSREGISKGIYQVGDVMYDSVLFYAEKAKSIEQKTLKKLNVQPRSFYLATVHRAENTENSDRLQSIFNALRDVSSPQSPTLLPLHPRTKKRFVEIGLGKSNDVQIIEPVSYLEMIALERNARAILTDSGGVQKEAYWFKVPCITLREETEWVETVESGWNTLAGANKKNIINAAGAYKKFRSDSPNTVYGNGHAAHQICEVLQRWQASHRSAKNM